VQSQYRSPFTVGKRKTVYIDAADPRVQGFKANITAARLGAELVIVDSRVNTLSQSGRLSNIRQSSPQAKQDGLNPKGENFIKPGNISNLSAEWQDLGVDGATLVIEFDFDFGEEVNQYVDKFVYNLTKLDNSFTTIDLESKTLNKSGTGQTIRFTEILNTNNFAEFQTDFLQLKVAAEDSFGNIGDFTTLTDIPAYQNTLPTPVITVTSILRGYSVDWVTVADQFEFISIEEVVSSASTAPASGYEQVYLDVKSIKPAQIITPTTESRWVRARFNNKGTLFSAYSNVVKVTPITAISADFTPPNEVTVNSATWSGYDLVVNYTMPASDPGARFNIVLTNGSANGYFYDYFPATTGTFNYTITDDLIFKQFGARYSSYTGKFISVDAAGNETTGTNFSTATIANPGAGVTPTFTLTGITNGYTATWTAPSWATLTKVYEGTASGFTPNDSTNLIYSGASPAIVKTLGRTDPYGRKYIVIRYIGKISGHQSNLSAEQFVDPIDSLTADILAPDAPSTGGSFAASAGIDETGTLGFNGFINLTWNAVSDPTLRGYRIQFRPYKASAPFENYSYVDSPGTGTTYRIGGLAIGAVYEVAVATHDEFNNTSAYTAYPNQTVSGTPAMSNYITAGAAGFQFGSGIKDKTGSQNASAQGLYLSNSNYWYLTSSNSAQFKVGGSSDNYIEWTGAKLNIDGDLGIAGGTTIGGNISMKNSGASIYAGTLTAGGALNSDGFLLNYNGLAIKKGAVNLRLDTTDGGIYAEFGQIAGWTIDSTKLQRGTGAVGNKYAGIGVGSTYSFWAGSDSSGGDASAKFLVTPAGAVTARNISIIGDGSTNKLLDVSSNFYVQNNGFFYATEAEIQGIIRAESGEITGNFLVKSPDGTIIVGPGGSNANSVVIKGGNGLNNDTNIGGLAAFNNAGAALTEILTRPITFGSTPRGQDTGGTSGNPLPVAINFFTSAALIGGWVVGDNTFSSRDQQFVIDSTGTSNEIRIYGSASGTNYVLKMGRPSSTFAPIIWAGPIVGGTPGTPNFSVSQEGNLTALNASIKGTVSVSDGNMKFGDGAGGSGVDGLFVNANNYIYKNGDFKLGTANTYMESSSGIVRFKAGGYDPSSGGGFDVSGIGADLNQTAGDTTLVKNVYGFMTTGRALFYGASNKPNTANYISRWHYFSQVSSANSSQNPHGWYSESQPGNFSVGDLWFSNVT